jgi:hypothetical protein
MGAAIALTVLDATDAGEPSAKVPNGTSMRSSSPSPARSGVQLWARPPIGIERQQRLVNLCHYLERDGRGDPCVIQAIGVFRPSKHNVTGFGASL